MASTSRQTASVAPSVSASGFSWPTASTSRAPRRRVTTSSGTASRARAPRSNAGVIRGGGWDLPDDLPDDDLPDDGLPPRPFGAWPVARPAGFPRRDGRPPRLSGRRRLGPRRPPGPRCRLRGAAGGPASAGTPSNGAISSGSAPGLELVEHVHHARRRLGRVVEADVELGDAPDAEPAAELVADVAHRLLQRAQRLVAVGLAADHADPHLRVARGRARSRPW